MRRLLRKRRSKTAMTMVELIVTMALTAIFAASCVALIFPIERVYTHMTDLSRAQLIADTCVDTLRKECAKTYIETPEDVWIFNDDDFNGTTGRLGAASSDPRGNVLVLRKNITYWETIASTPKYEMQKNLYNGVLAAEGSEAQKDGYVMSRAIYRMFDPITFDPSPDTKAGFVHFGYYEKTGLSSYDYYDFTNPFTSATYRDYKVELKFNGIHKTSEDLPAYVNCTIKVTKNGAEVYERNTILCFASPVKR